MPVLARPDFSKHFIIQTNASATAIGEFLTQVNDEGEEHPIAKRNYTTTERELLGLIYGSKKMHPYLEGYKFVAVKDLIFA